MLIAEQYTRLPLTWTIVIVKVGVSYISNFTSQQINWREAYVYKTQQWNIVTCVKIYPTKSGEYYFIILELGKCYFIVFRNLSYAIFKMNGS